MSPFVGLSLYSWTSIIGTVLFGLSIGNYLGGKIADTQQSIKALSFIFVTSSILCLFITKVSLVNDFIPQTLPVFFRIVLLANILFLLPNIALGMISPITIKLAISKSNTPEKIGYTIGSINAIGTIASLFGTFLTGFYLISHFGVFRIIYFLALILFVLGVFLLVRTKRLFSITSLLMGVFTIVSILICSKLSNTLCDIESNYYCMKIYDWKSENNEDFRVLNLDNLTHSFNSLSNPSRLYYDYEKDYLIPTEYIFQKDNYLKTLFVGGGGYTFPRYIEANYPQSLITVLEIDPQITKVAYKFMGLDKNSRIRSINEDARVYVHNNLKQSYNIIFGDAYQGFSPPYHLTTKEYNDQIKSLLAPSGLYIANVIDGKINNFNFIRSIVYTLSKTFKYIYIAPTYSNWIDFHRCTFIIYVSSKPLPLALIQLIEKNSKVPLIYSNQLQKFLSSGKKILLTDDFAPVEHLTAGLI